MGLIVKPNTCDIEVERGSIMDQENTRRDHVLLLKGERGKRIFKEILNGPKVPYERLRKETDEAMARILESGKNEDK